MSSILHAEVNQLPAPTFERAAEAAAQRRIRLADETNL